jgi:hypothetical protein
VLEFSRLSRIAAKNETENYNSERGSDSYVPDENSALCPVDLSVRLFGDVILVTRCVPP